MFLPAEGKVAVLKYAQNILFFLTRSALKRTLVGKELACYAGDPGSIPGSGRPPGEGIGYQSSILRLPWWLRQ